MYNEKVMEAFQHPQNVGEIEDYDGIGTVGNAVCGDIMQITIKVKDGKIADAKFKTFGCAAADYGYSFHLIFLPDSASPTLFSA